MIIIPVLSNCSPRKTGLIETIGSGSSFSTVSAPRPYEPVFAYFGKKTDFFKLWILMAHDGKKKKVEIP